MFEKVWQQHVVAEPAGEPTILYIDLQLVHEVTSPQAFEGLRLAGRKLRSPVSATSPPSTTTSPPPASHDRLVITDQIASARSTPSATTAPTSVEFFDTRPPSRASST